MNDSEALRIVEGIEIPSIPHVLRKILMLTNDPNSSSRDIEKLVLSEPGLVTHILKTVNSAFFGTPCEVRSVNHAIVLLGFSAVRSIVSGLVLIDVFHNLPGLDKKYVLNIWIRPTRLPRESEKGRSRKFRTCWLLEIKRLSTNRLQFEM